MLLRSTVLHALRGKGPSIQARGVLHELIKSKVVAHYRHKIAQTFYVVTALASHPGTTYPGSSADHGADSQQPTALC